MADKTYYALRSFLWEGENIAPGDPVKLSPLNAKWMLGRGAVTETKPVASKKAKKS